MTSKLSDNKTMISRSNVLEKTTSDFKDKGYTFRHIEEMHIKTIANKLDMSNDYHIKHDMCALEWIKRYD